MIITARDIRQQIEVEANLYRLARAERARAAELSAVIRGMGEGVLVCDPSGRVILSNPAAATILARTVERYEDLVALVEPPPHGLPQLASAGGPVEVRLVAADRWVDISTYPVSLDGGETFGEAETTIIVLRDVTAARRARAAREAFIGVMSHELRTPITTIYGTTKLFSRAADSPDLMKSMLADVEAEVGSAVPPRRGSADPEPIRDRDPGRGRARAAAARRPVRSCRARQARWPETRFVAIVPAGSAAGHRRQDVSRAGRAQPAQQRREIQSARDTRRDQRGDRRSARSSSASSTPAPGFSPDEAEIAVRIVLPLAIHLQEGNRRGHRAVRVAGADRGDGRADLGHRASGGRRRIRVPRANPRTRARIGRSWTSRRCTLNSARWYGITCTAALELRYTRSTPLSGARHTHQEAIRPCASRRASCAGSGSTVCSRDFAVLGPGRVRERRHSRDRVRRHRDREAHEQSGVGDRPERDDRAPRGRRAASSAEGRRSTFPRARRSTGSRRAAAP